MNAFKILTVKYFLYAYRTLRCIPAAGLLIQPPNLMQDFLERGIFREAGLSERRD